MKIYRTKYIFVYGITVHDAEIIGDMAVVRAESVSATMHLHGEGKEWHKSYESALQRAEELRIKRLKSLDKQIKKMSAIVFSCP